MDKVLINRTRTLGAVLVPCAGLAVDPAHPLGFRQNRADESDGKSGKMPGEERTQAGVELQRWNPYLKLVLAGGVCSEGQPAIADIMEYDALAFGAPQGALIKAGGTDTTTQVSSFVHVAREHGWRAEDVGVVTVDWHYNRVEALLHIDEAASYFGNRMPTWISVERILCAVDPQRWVPYFEKYYTDPDVQRILVDELLGGCQMRTGHHWRYGTRPYIGLKDPLE